MGPYVLDFYCAELGLVVEVDGGQHGLHTRALHDQQRDAWLAMQGLRVLRFWNSEIIDNLPGVLEAIRVAVLAGRGVSEPSMSAPQGSDPLPSSPFQGEGGLVGPSALNAEGSGPQSVQSAPPPPERGRMGGGREAPQGASPVLVVAGGVAANQAIRARLAAAAGANGFRLVAPPARLCSDTGVMIAWAGAERLALGLADPLDAAARPRWPLDELAAPVLGSGGKGAKA